MKSARDGKLARCRSRSTTGVQRLGVPRARCQRWQVGALKADGCHGMNAAGARCRPKSTAVAAVAHLRVQGSFTGAHLQYSARCRRYTAAGSLYMKHSGAAIKMEPCSRGTGTEPAEQMRGPAGLGHTA